MMGDSHCWETEEGLDLEMGEVLCHLDLSVLSQDQLLIDSDRGLLQITENNDH